MEDEIRYIEREKKCPNPECGSMNKVLNVDTNSGISILKERRLLLVVYSYSIRY